MATRDLTDHFVRQRSALHRKVPGGPRGDDFGGSGLLGSAGGSGLDTAPLALSGASPVYVEMVNEITADMDGLNAKSAWCARGVAAPPPSPPPHTHTLPSWGAPTRAYRAPSFTFTAGAPSPAPQ